jgi:long-chain fatty acid transport protein
MSSNKKNLALAFAVAAAVMAPSAFATNGYFSHGYGMKAKGMAGASTALADDSFGGANNPASMVWAGNRFDLGLDYFSPIRNAARGGATNGLNSDAESGSTDFFIPEFGYNTMLSATSSFGVTVYGNGGMNTNYPGGQITGGGSGVCNAFGVPGTGQNLLCGTGRLGVDLSQLVVAPTWAFKVDDKNSLGISPLLGWQRFKAEGLDAFAGLSSDSSRLTNKGYDTSTGVGARFGWMTKASDVLSLGAAYSTKIKMSKFQEYRGLFAEGGDFDMPANYNVGLALKLASSFTVALDYQGIEYSGVKSVSNPSTNSGALGTSNGRGFGWDNVIVKKLGVEYKPGDRTTLRAGYSHANNPIGARDVTFNILAPGVIEDHMTLGLTYATEKNSELTVAYMHAFKNSVEGPSLFNALGVAGSGNEKIEMYQNSLGVAWAKKW